MKLLSFSWLFLLFFFSGCTTLLYYDGEQSVTVKTKDGNMSHLLVIQDESIKEVNTSTSISIPRNDDDLYLVSPTCYEPAFKMKLKKEIDDIAYWNVYFLFFPVVNLITPLLAFSADILSERSIEITEPIEVPSNYYVLGCTEENRTIDLSKIPEIPYQNYTVPDQKIEAMSQKQGLVFTNYNGEAIVRSYVSDGLGNEHVVANGFQRQVATKLSLHNPVTTDFFSYDFVPRYFHQTVEIKGFRQTIPHFFHPNKTTIPYSFTSFETGQSVDPEDPDVYDITMDSLGVDFMIKAGVNYDCSEDFECILHLGAQAGVSLLEIQYLDTTLGRDRITNTRLHAFDSTQLSVGGYLLFPEFTPFGSDGIFVEFGYHRMRYPSIDLSHALEFKDSVKFNHEKQIFERNRIFVNDVELDVISSSFSIGVLF